MYTPRMRPTIPGSFGAELRQYREAAGLTQTQLAERSGIERTHMSRLESGDRRPSRRAVAEIVAAFPILNDRDVDRLFVVAGFAPTSRAALAAIFERGER